MAEQPSFPSNGPWYHTRDGHQVGPVALTDLERMALSGDLRRSDWVWAPGMANWTAAGDVPQLRCAPEVVPPPPPSLSGSLPLSPSVTVESARAPAAKPPWNPTTIAWLGLPFSPIWAAIMTALNYRRLGEPGKWWRPCAIGIVLYLVVGSFFESIWAHLLLTVGFVGALYSIDLKAQMRVWQRRAVSPSSSASWLVASLCGTPLLMLTLFAMFRPLEPREVCERFMAASTENAAKKYCTSNLWPAIHVLSTVSGADQGDADYELTDEGWAREDFGGYLVYFRMIVTEGRETVPIDGVFHLIEREGWKVEDLYFLAVGGQPAEEPIPLSIAYLDLAQAMTQGQVASMTRTSPSGGSTNRWVRTAAARGGAALFIKGGGLKALGILIVAIGSGAVAIVRHLAGKKETKRR